MTIEQFRWLAGVVAAHPEDKVVGRTRLQKTIRLLQRCGFPTRYSYTLFFYGPYSVGVQADLRLLGQLGLLEEQECQDQDGMPYYVMRARPGARLEAVERWRPAIDTLSRAPAVVLELAATYDTFRGLGSNHAEALQRLRRKKGSKCDGGNEAAALALLQELGLPVGGVQERRTQT
jgi:uncharacterized protein YwgA